MRLVLRYDMLRAWKTSGSKDGAVTVASVPPARHGVSSVSGNVGVGVGVGAAGENGGEVQDRRALMPNVLPTLIAAPAQGYSTHGVRERMKHHVTDLDGYLLLTDEEVRGWGAARLLSMMCALILHWQWLRQSNEILGDMEVTGWEDLDGKADECEWIADDVKKTGGVGGGGKKDKEKDKEKN